MVPVATNEKQMKELFNLTKVQYGEKAVKNITYGIDTGLRNAIDKAMKDQGKDLNKIKFVPNDSIWFVEKKETKATKATEMKKAEQET